MVSLLRSVLLNGGLAGAIAVGTVVGVVVFGGLAVSSGDLPPFSGATTEQDQRMPTTQTPSANTPPIATPTSTPTATQTPTTTSTPTAIPTPSEADLRQEYEHVREEYLEKWPRNPDQYPTVPELLGTEIRMNQDALWVVFDETDVFENASRMRDEWTGVANAYLHALNNHTGPAPNRMVAVGWNNTGPITYFRVQTDDARARLNRNISYNTFYNRFVRTVRATNDAERSIARDIAEHPPDDN